MPARRRATRQPRLAGMPTARFTEADFQKQVIELAHRYGFMVEHKYAQGAILGSKALDPGFPDLVLVKARPHGRLIFADRLGLG